MLTRIILAAFALTLALAARPGSAQAPAAEVLPPFGAQLFTGSFIDEVPDGFNPNYQISIGDELSLQMWGAVTVNEVLTVDAQGNVFIPEVGPVHVQGVRNDELNGLIQRRVGQVYESNVGVYTNLRTVQPVSVFVTGFVVHPGLYTGLSSDSVLSFLDRAGGIDPERGSFLDVRVMRGGALRHRVDLYGFLLRGELPYLQLHAGDTIVVGPVGPRIAVGGAVANAYRFEFASDRVPAPAALALARPHASATHLQVVRRVGAEKRDFYLPLASVATFELTAGDEVTLVADRNDATVLVSVRGEHVGERRYALRKGAKLVDLLDRVEVTDRSEIAGVQLFRRSVAERQKERFEASLARLEQTVLSARSSSADEATLRLKEAELLMKFIERARLVEPRGQVVLAVDRRVPDIYLEDGDVVTIPSKSSLVMVHGEVLMPTALLHERGASVRAYIERAGGFSENADANRVLILRVGGEVAPVGDLGRSDVNSGDEILVLPKVNLKNLQFAKDISQVLYQIAIAAGVVLAL